MIDRTEILLFGGHWDCCMYSIVYALANRRRRIANRASDDIAYCCRTNERADWRKGASAGRAGVDVTDGSSDSGTTQQFFTAASATTMAHAFLLEQERFCQKGEGLGGARRHWSCRQANDARARKTRLAAHAPPQFRISFPLASRLSLRF